MKKANKYTIITLLLTSMLTIMVGAAIAPSLVPIVKNLNFKFSPALLITIPSLGVVVFSALSGWLHKRFGSFMLLFFGLGYFAIASASLIMILYIGAFMLGIGFGLTVPTLNHMMVDVSNYKNRGKNLSLYSMGVFGGQFASTFLGYIYKAEITLFFAAGILSFIVASAFFILFRKIK